MKNNFGYKSIIGFIALACITASCTSDNDADRTLQRINVTATMQSTPVTRLAYDDQLGDDGLGSINVTWTAGDAFALEDGTIFTIPANGTDGTTASFTGTYDGELDGQTVYFPAAGHINSITYEVGQVQEGDNNPAHLSQFNRMVGTITGNANDGYTVSFEQKTTIFKLSLNVIAGKQVKDIYLFDFDVKDCFKRNLNGKNSDISNQVIVTLYNGPTNGKVTAYVMGEVVLSPFSGIEVYVFYTDGSDGVLSIEAPLIFQSGKAYLIEGTVE